MKMKKLCSALLSAVLAAGMMVGTVSTPVMAAETASESTAQGSVVDLLRIGICKDIEPRSLDSSAA